MSGKHIGLSAIAAAVLAGMPGVASAVRLNYVIDAGVERNDNVGLSTTDPITQNILRAGLGFTLSENTSTIQAEISGRADYYNYPDTFADRTDGTMTAFFNWVAIPERLHFVVEDNLTVQPISTLVPDAPGNRQQLNVLSLGPTLLFRWTQNLHGAVDLRYINSDAEVTEEFDSQRLNLGLRTIRELGPTSRISFNLLGQTVDFDNDLVARDYDRADAFARYERDLANFDLRLDLGWSQLDYDDGESDSNPLIRTDLGWNPSARSRYTLTAWSQFSDVATDVMTTLTPGAEIPVRLPIGDVVVSSSQYEERRIALSYEFTGERTTFSVAPYVYEARYVDSSEFDQDGDGVRLDFTRRLRPTVHFNAYAVLDRIDYLTRDREDKTRRYGLGLQKDWTRRWSSRLEWARYERDISIPGLDTDQNSVYLSVTYANR